MSREQQLNYANCIRQMVHCPIVCLMANLLNVANMIGGNYSIDKAMEVLYLIM